MNTYRTLLVCAAMVVSSRAADSCIDDNAGFKALGFPYPTCQVGAAQNGCSNPLVGETIRKLCCKSCKATQSQCLDNDQSIAGVTAGKVSTCKDAAQQGYCVTSPFASDNALLPQIVGNGAACCKSCKALEQKPFDTPLALNRFTLSQFSDCKQLTQIGGCFYNETLSTSGISINIMQLTRSTCGGSCAALGDLQVCADHDALITTYIPPITFQGRQENITCALAKAAAGCDPSTLAPYIIMSPKKAKEMRQLLKVACCDSCDPKKKAEVAVYNNKVLEREYGQHVAERTEQKDALIKKLVGLQDYLPPTSGSSEVSSSGSKQQTRIRALRGLGKY